MRVCPQLQPRVFLLAARKGMCARENVDGFPLRGRSSVDAVCTRRHRGGVCNGSLLSRMQQSPGLLRPASTPCGRVKLELVSTPAREGCSKKKCHPKGEAS